MKFVGRVSTTTLRHRFRQPRQETNTAGGENEQGCSGDPGSTQEGLQLAQSGPLDLMDAFARETEFDGLEGLQLAFEAEASARRIGRSYVQALV